MTLNIYRTSGNVFRKTLGKNLVLLFLLVCHAASGQTISGIVLDKKENTPIAYVNIGIEGKNIGTVSGADGKFSLYIDPAFDGDTLLISCIGYQPLALKISQIRRNPDIKLMLEEKSYGLEEVIIRPKQFKTKILGVTTKVKSMRAGFEENMLGYECGVLMKNKKVAVVEKVDFNIAACSYDTLFYRLNIYKVHGKSGFENILKEPIYIKLSKNQVKKEFQIDLTSRNIIIEGDFLVTLEHVRDLGKGYLYFCAGLMDKTYYRKTSQGKWETAPVGVSISVVADVER
jgi:hypothetical protein